MKTVKFKKWNYIFCFIIIILSMSLSLTSCARTVGMKSVAQINPDNLTNQEKVLLEKYDNTHDLSKRLSLSKTDKNDLFRQNSKNKRTKNVVQIIDGPNTSLKIKETKCISNLYFEPFITDTMPLSALIRFLRGHGVEIIIDSNKKNKFNLEQNINLGEFKHNINLCEIIDILRKQIVGSVRLEKGNMVVFSPFEQTVWHLPVMSNKYSAYGKMSSGSRGGSEQGLGGFSISASYSHDINFVEKIEKKLSQLLPESRDGYWVLDQDLGLLTVYAIPSKMIEVRRFLQNLSQAMGKIARIRLTIFEVGKTKDKQRGIDWALALREALIKKPWKLGLKSEMVDITINSPVQGIVGTEEAYQLGIASIEDSNRFKTIFNILSKHNDVTIVESTDLLLMNGHPVVLAKGQDMEYISEVSKDVTSDVGMVSYNVQKDHVYSGLKIYVDGTIRKRSLTLSLMFEMQQLVKMETITFPDYKIQSPTVSVRSQSITLNVRDGETQVLAGMSGERSTLDFDGTGIKHLDTIVGLSRRNGENSWLVFLITPHILKSSEMFYEVKI